MSKIVFRNCKYCHVKVNNRYAFYCSNKCQMDYRYFNFISKWLDGDINGSIGIHVRTMSKHIRRYMDEKYGKACNLCGWNRIHPVTGKVPLEIDHIDGNPDNHYVKNLRLICPNCHALSINFRALNRGKGRDWRRNKYNKITPPM